MKKVLVFGGSGMLGHALVRRWKSRFDVWSTFSGRVGDVEKHPFYDPARMIADVTATDRDSIARAFETARPDVVFNAIGVIKQQPTSKNAVRTIEINALFPHLLAEEVERSGARLISISTDCVFSGRTGNYDESSVPDAGDLYGLSKRLGEVIAPNCLTLRTSIIGRELTGAHGLVEWFLGNRGGRVKGFSRAVFSGFPTVVLADIIADLIDNHPKLEGLFHVSAEPIDKLSLLGLVRDEFAADIEIEQENEFKIDRSLNSDRFREVTGFRPAPWPEMIRTMANDAVDYDLWRK